LRLKRFEVRNFKAIHNVSIDLDDLVVVIGENNCGKSCLLLALSWFLSGTAIKDKSLFHRYQTGEANAVELIGHFDQLTERDLNEVAIRGRTNGSDWTLKKKYWLEDANGGERGGWKEQLYSHSSQEIFVGWPDPANTWNSFPADYQPLIEQLANRGRPNSESRDRLKALVRQARPNLIQMAAPSWIENPGGGGNWKSNANSIVPRPIFIRAIHDASDESVSKDASSYGKLVNLIIERRLSGRPEINELKEKLESVMELFTPNEAHPERQAEEIRDLQDRITAGLNNVIGGQALIKTHPIQLGQLLMPNTSLVIKDSRSGIETNVGDQGHGLQRTLIMTLLQLLAESQERVGDGGQEINNRPTVLIVEEPELYMHPQMERRMRDTLYKIADEAQMQVVCSTHSPVFLDIAEKYQSIVRLVRDAETGKVASYQVRTDLFPGGNDRAEKERLQTVSRFNPAVSELFFSNDVVLFEEFSAIAAFERAADLTGIFERHPNKRRELTTIDCAGKPNIPAFQRVLNAFRIRYRVVHDEDRNNPQALGQNARIAGLAAAVDPPATTHLLSPDNLESILQLPGGGSAKPYIAVKKVEELLENGNLPDAFRSAMNFVYFGTLIEPAQ
jgi:putative ATP-dependent endonuclease of the OLD family